MSIQVTWFKRDLRIHDHAPLRTAAAAGPVLALYIVEPDYYALPDVSARHYGQLRVALAELQVELQRLGGALVIRVGDAETVFGLLLAALPIAAIHAHAETGNAHTYDRDQRLRRLFKAHGVAFNETRQFGVVRGLRERRAWAAQWEALMAMPVTAPPARIEPVVMASDPLPVALGDPTHGAVDGWTRARALARLQRFLDIDAEQYRRGMSAPASARTACSRLSVALASGVISLREVVGRVRAQRAALADGPPRPALAAALAALESRLHWHCHFIQKLESEPEIEHAPINAGYRALRDAQPDPERLARWCSGQTGWPLVDACMRAVNRSGWLNFRMRAMLVAISSYHLWQPWREPGLHLARVFADYEPGIHWPQVQMQSGVTGINVPRIYNPLKQSLDQDPDGTFIREQLPELAALPKAYVHQPWQLSAALQSRYGVRLDRDYPRPLVDHEVAARQARARLSAHRAQTPMLGALNQAVLRKHGSRKRDVSVKPRPGPVQGVLF